MCVAIDRLGGIQELLGPGTADRLVRSVADSVASLIRTSDIVARLDDDRVVAVLPRAPAVEHFMSLRKSARPLRRKAEPAASSQHHGLDRRGDIPCLRRQRVLAIRRGRRGTRTTQSQGRNQACLAPRRSALRTGPSSASNLSVKGSLAVGAKMKMRFGALASCSGSRTLRYASSQGSEPCRLETRPTRRPEPCL